MNGSLRSLGNESLVVGLETLRTLELPHSIQGVKKNNASCWSYAGVGRISFSNRRIPQGLDEHLKGKGRSNEPSVAILPIQLGRRLMPRLLAEPSLAVYKLHVSKGLGTEFSPYSDESKTLTVFQKYRGEERLGDAEAQLSVTRQMRMEPDGMVHVHLELGFVQAVCEIDLFADIVGRRIDQLTQETSQPSQ